MSEALDTKDALLLVFNNGYGTSFVRADQIRGIVALDEAGFRSRIVLLGGEEIFATETPDALLEKLTNNG